LFENSLKTRENFALALVCSIETLTEAKMQRSYLLLLGENIEKKVMENPAKTDEGQRCGPEIEARK
jgi:hypothetical protein